MSDELLTRNKSGLKINCRLLKKIILYTLKEVLKENDFNLAIFLVSLKAIEDINKRFLNHNGPTDVISFDYSSYEELSNFELEKQNNNQKPLYGEIYICPDIAREQSKLFNTTQQEEIIRYAIHGILHIKGYDDLTPGERKKMRKMENSIISQIRKKFNINELLKK